MFVGANKSFNIAFLLHSVPLQWSKEHGKPPPIVDDIQILSTKYLIEISLRLSQHILAKHELIGVMVYELPESLFRQGATSFLWYPLLIPCTNLIFRRVLWATSVVHFTLAWIFPLLSTMAVAHDGRSRQLRKL